MLPEAFLTRLKEQLGDEFDDYLRSLDRPRAVALRFNPMKTDVFPALPFTEEPVPWADLAITIPPMPGPDSTSGTRRACTTSRRPVPWPP